MVFKKEWEKVSAIYSLPNTTIEQMVKMAYPSKNLVFHEIITSGCANLNIKIQLDSDFSPLILRIYLRDKDAVYREKKIGELLKDKIPIPQIFYIGKFEEYYFSLVEFIQGVTLSDFLIHQPQNKSFKLMYDVGAILAKITRYEFSKSGFFNKDLTSISEFPEDFILNFANTCLEHNNVSHLLDANTISKIERNFYKYQYLFDSLKEKHLVHGDFDPSNILVNQVAGKWQISGILDWEFAFSGSVLCDIANMLRYAHKMPIQFQNEFLKGLIENGICLPENWQILAHLSNLLALLDCLQRAEPQKQPKKCADINGLINYILTKI